MTNTDTQHDRVTRSRDPLGISSLYYTQANGRYLFASDIGDLLSYPDVVKKPNLRSLATMIHCFAVDHEETMYEGIYRLPPGHSITIEEGKKTIERTWFPEKIKIDHGISEEEAARKLKILFEQAVERSVSDLKETAFEVSGGLDSSSVVSVLAQKNETSKIDSYFMSFGDLKCDEGAYVDALLERYPLNHRKIAVEKLDYHAEYSLEALYALSPHWPISLTFAMIVPMLEKMEQDGKKVVVSGQGGDHLFTGSPYVLYDLLFRGEFRAFYEELRSHRRPWNALKAYVLKPLLGEKLVGKVKKMLGKNAFEGCFENACDIRDLTDREGIKNPALKNELDALTSAYQSTVMDGNIFHCAERHFGIEYRHPFFDKELVEFALSLPPEMKYKNRTIKRILRKAMQGILPEKIRTRRDKAEFSEILTQQIDAIDLDALFEDAHLVRLGIVSRSDIAQCLEKYRSGNLRYISYLWTLVNVEYWYGYNTFDESEVRRGPL